MINLKTTKELKDISLKIYNKLELEKWLFYCALDRCLICKGFKGSFLLNKKINGVKTKVINPSFLLHLYTAHGLPPTIVIDKYIKDVYKFSQDREKATIFYDNFYL